MAVHTTAITSLLLILILAAFVVLYPTPHGFAIQIAERVPCGSNGSPVLEVRNDGSLTANGIIVEMAQLEGYLRRRFGNRTERVAYVKSDPAVAFQAVAGVIDAVQQQRAKVALVLPSIEGTPGCFGIPAPPIPNTLAPLIELKPVPLWP